MKKKYKEFNRYSKLLLVAVSSTVILFTGCQSGNAIINNTNTDNSNTENNQVIDSNTTESDSTDTITPVEETIQFSELSKYEFVFSSGVGAWQTMLNINEDGSFQGLYSDSDMGDTGEGYPNGIIYSSKFEGEFTTPK